MGTSPRALPRMARVSSSRLGRRRPLQPVIRATVLHIWVPAPACPPRAWVGRPSCSGWTHRRAPPSPPRTGPFFTFEAGEPPMLHSLRRPWSRLARRGGRAPFFGLATPNSGKSLTRVQVMNRPLPGVSPSRREGGWRVVPVPRTGPAPHPPRRRSQGPPKLPRTSPRDVRDACVTVVAAEAGSRPPTPRSPRTPVPCTRDRTCGARYCSGASVPALAPAAGPGSLRLRRSGVCGTCRPATGIGRPNSERPPSVSLRKEA